MNDRINGRAADAFGYAPGVLQRILPTAIGNEYDIVCVQLHIILLPAGDFSQSQLTASEALPSPAQPDSG